MLHPCVWACAMFPLLGICGYMWKQASGVPKEHMKCVVCEAQCQVFQVSQLVCFWQWDSVASVHWRPSHPNGDRAVWTVFEARGPSQIAWASS